MKTDLEKALEIVESSTKLGSFARDPQRSVIEKTSIALAAERESLPKSVVSFLVKHLAKDDSADIAFTELRKWQRGEK